MTYRQTFVVEYPDNTQAPRVGANMELFGGKLVAVQFSDALQDVEQMHNALQEADTIMGHDDAETEWRDKWAHLWGPA